MNDTCWKKYNKKCASDDEIIIHDNPFEITKNILPIILRSKSKIMPIENTLKINVSGNYFDKTKIQ